MFIVSVNKNVKEKVLCFIFVTFGILAHRDTTLVFRNVSISYVQSRSIEISEILMTW